MSEPQEAAHSKKRPTKQNALKHGAYSRELMLPGEKMRDYEALGAELNEEWAPEGATERGLVDRLVALYWRKQRLDRYEVSKLQQRVDEIERKNWISRHRQNLKNLGPEFNSATSFEAVEQILSLLTASYVHIITGAVPRETCQDPAKWGPAIAASLSRLVPEDQLEGAAKFIAIVNPDLIENDMARSDRVDEAIDRTIKRLMQVKTAKQIFPSMRRNPQADPKLINVPAPVNPNLQGRESEQNVKLLDKVEIPAKPKLNWRPGSADYNRPILKIS
jgi:hypothetical protein